MWSGSLAELRQVRLQAAEADSRLQGALQRLHRLRQQLQDSASAVGNSSSTAAETNRLTALTRSTGWSAREPAPPTLPVAVTLPVPACSVSQARQKLGEVERRAEHLVDQIKPLSMLGETINRNLSEIRELINQARRQAASVKPRTPPPRHATQHKRTPSRAHAALQGCEVPLRRCCVWVPAMVRSL